MKRQIRSAATAASLLGCALLPGCSKVNATAQQAPIPVKVETVRDARPTLLARYSGVLEPAARVDMAFRLSGYVENLGQVRGSDGTLRALDKGDVIKKGSVLARLRTLDYVQKLGTAQASADEARAEAQLAALELARAQRLFEGKAITRAELDSKQARAERAQATLAGARARAGEANVALDDTVLRAPFDSVVVARQVELGSLVAPGQIALSLADMRTMKAVFGVPEALVPRLPIGAPLRVFVHDARSSTLPERGVDAAVTRIAPAADAMGRVFSVEALLPNADAALRAGAVVSVHVPGGARAGLSVPLASVVRSPLHKAAFAVFVLPGEAYEAPAGLHEVQLGEVLGNDVSVKSGLSAGQRVVTVGSTLLRDGDQAVVIR